MFKESKTLNSELIRWHKAFGVDHVFFETNLKQKSHSAVTTFEFEDLEKLKKTVLNLDCNLKKTAKNTVFSGGNYSSDIMIIGEAPGKEEDEQGLPFVGQSGKLLDNMLMSIGLKRSDVYISNILFWRPPGNRTPSSEEISFCMPYVENHIKLAKPKILLLLGGIAVKSILNSNDPISRLRGKASTYHEIPVIPSFHPAYLLRSPGQKSVAFRDFILLKKLIHKIK